jgi:AraC family transcriptional regulator
MGWIKRLNEVINYIEEHITEELSYEQMAKIACCSTYHFQRMFSYLANVPLSEYIRRRKMSLAVTDLQRGDKILNVAMKYGYDSPTAFNRAFQKVHGIAPSGVRQDGVSLKLFPPICFKITIKGMEELNFRIEKKGKFRIVGIASPLPGETEENFEIFPRIWHNAVNDGTVQELIAMRDGLPAGLLGVSICDEWRYFIGVTSSKETNSKLDEYIVPALTWAVFSGEGHCPGAIRDLERRIITDWFPTSGYEFDSGPDIEIYSTPDMENVKFEVWIPITREKQQTFPTD